MGLPGFLNTESLTTLRAHMTESDAAESSRAEHDDPPAEVIGALLRYVEEYTVPFFSIYVGEDPDKCSAAKVLSRLVLEPWAQSDRK